MIYAYALQIRMIMTYFPHHQIRPITSRSQIKGVEMQKFVYVSNHVHKVPPDLLDYVKERGFIIITIDESHSRDYYAMKEKRK